MAAPAQFSDSQTAVLRANMWGMTRFWSEPQMAIKETANHLQSRNSSLCVHVHRYLAMQSEGLQVYNIRRCAKTQH